MIFFGMSRDLQFRPSNIRLWLQFLEQNDGKKVVVDIEVDKAKRSLDQNAYYWNFLEIIAKETGHYADELHRLFKGLFLTPKMIIFKGKSYTLSGSTTTLNKPQFSEYLDRIAAETGIPLPDKNVLIK